jgi:hypothetical protein
MMWCDDNKLSFLLDLIFYEDEEKKEAPGLHDIEHT